MIHVLRRRMTFCAAALLLALTLAPANAMAATSDDLFNNAVQSYVAGRVDESMMYLKQVLTQNPSHERARKLFDEVKRDMKEAGKPVDEWMPPAVGAKAAPDAAQPAKAAPAKTAPGTARTPDDQTGAEPPADVIIEDVVITEEAPAKKPAKAPKAPKAEKKKAERKIPEPKKTETVKAEPGTVAVPATRPARTPDDQAGAEPQETAPAQAAATEETKPAPAAEPAPVAKSEPARAELVTVPKAEPVTPAKEPAAAEAPPALRFGASNPPDPEEPSVYSIDVYGDPAAPLVFIRTTEGVDFLPNPIASPPTMAIDLPGAVDRLPAKKSFDVKRGPIVRIRHSQYRTFPIMTARVSIELRKGSEQPVVEPSKSGYWVRFGGAQVPEALAAIFGAPMAAAKEAPVAAPTVEVGPQYIFTEFSGFGQDVMVNQKARSLTLKVIEAVNAQPVSDLPVTFEIVSGAASLSGVVTDAVKKLVVKTTQAGIAEAPLVVGNKVESIFVRVFAGDAGKFNLLEMTLPVKVVAGVARHIEKISGDLQDAISGEEIKDPLVVRVTDDFGNPAPNAKVQFTILKGNGRLDAIRLNDPRDNDALTDTMGMARCEVWVLGVEPGEQLVEARITGITGVGESVLFSAKAAQRIVSLDFKDAVVIDVVRTLAQLGNMNVIFDLEYDDARQKFVVPFLDPLDPKGAVKKIEMPPLTIHVVDVTVLEALDMVLESAGLTRVLEGNTIRIIAKQRALGRPLPVTTDTPATGGKFVTHVFKLLYTDAENMQKLLGQFVEREGGDIIADPLTNQLMVVQTADNTKRIGDIVALLDVPYARAKETNLEIRRFVVKNVSAIDMAERLATVLSGPSFEFTLIASDLSIKKKGTVDFKTATLKKSTKVGGKGGDKVEEEFVKQILTLNVMTVNPSGNTITVLSTREIISLVGQVIESLDVKTEFSDVAVQEFKLRYLNMEEGIALMKRYLSPNGSYKEFTEIGTILVNDSRETIQRVEAALTYLDRGVKKLSVYKFKYLDPRSIQASGDQELINRILELAPDAGSRQKTTTFDLFSFQQTTKESVKTGPPESWWMIDATSKTLVIFDAPRNVEKVINFVKQLDDANMVEVEFKVYTLKYAKASDIHDALKDFLINPANITSQPTRVWTEGELPGRIPAVVTVMANTNSLLAAVNKSHIDKLERLIERLDIMNPSNPDLVTRTIFLKFGNAPNIAAGLKTFLTDDRTIRDKLFGIVNADATSNSLVILGTAESVKAIEDVVLKLDVPAAGQPATRVKVYQLKNIPSDEAVKLLRALFTQELSPGSNLTGVVGKVESLERANLIAIATQESFIPMIDEMIANIDILSPPPPDMATEVFYLNNAKPSDIAGILQGTLSQEFFTIDPTTGKLTSKSGGSAEGLAERARPGANQIGLFVRFSPDDRLNALTVIAPPAVMKVVAELIRKLDQRAPQVLIDATILEFSLTDDNARGINFITQPELLRDNSGLILNPLDVDALTKGLGKVGTEFAPGLIGAGAYRVILNAGQMRILMEALMSTGKVEVLATPKITALNNKAAEISAGTAKQFEVATVTPSGAPAATLLEDEALLKLTVTPTISNDRSVNLAIALEINEFLTNPSPGAKSEKTKRAARSSILLGDNQTLVLGGVIRDRRETKSTAVPVLKDIPVLGNLFKSKREQTFKTELMIFITPRVITNLPEATQVTKDVAKSLQQITPFPVNINTSSVSEIAELTGLRSDVDPDQHFRLSQRIVARRKDFGPFQSLEQLLIVPGLTRVIFDDIVYRIEYKVDVNVVNLQELVRIKGITLGMAQKIVEERKVRGIFRSEEEFESLMLGLGMNKGFYDRFLKPVIIVQAGTVGSLSLAPEQLQKLPVAPEGQFTEPAPSKEAVTPKPAPAPAPAPAPRPQSMQQPAPVVVPQPERTTSPYDRPTPTRTQTVSPAPTPTQKTTTTTKPVAAPPAPTQKTTTTGVAPTTPTQPTPAPSPQPQQPAAPQPAPKETETPYDASLPMPDLKPSVSPKSAEEEKKGKINLNTASVQDLMKLPGIDEYRAKMIDAYRYTYGKFKTVSDVKQVPDITDEIYDQIKDLIVAAP